MLFTYESILRLVVFRIVSQQIANRNWLWAHRKQTIVLCETSVLEDGTSLAFFVGYFIWRQATLLRFLSKHFLFEMNGVDKRYISRFVVGVMA